MTSLLARFAFAGHIEDGSVFANTSSACVSISVNVPVNVVVKEEEQPPPPYTPRMAKVKVEVEETERHSMLLRTRTRTRVPITPPRTANKQRASPAMKLKREAPSSPSIRVAKKTKTGPGVRKRSSSYAPPERYKHLKPLNDILTEGLLVMFVGLNPGIKTAETGHPYAGASNGFYKHLYSSGLTPDRKLHYSESRSLPNLYSLGTTNLVERPTRNQAELSKEDMLQGVPVLEEKVAKYKPECVCIVGKRIYEFVANGGKSLPASGGFKFGWQDGFVLGASEEWEGAKVFVTPSTSGLCAGYSPEFKSSVWDELGRWVQTRRAEIL
ncbi:hypothetical protein HDU76_005161 [Blyttiomyces sp. JEL0837]|nr:hypothetical protein HDU76_005161 [Blyttiomyces sp. JEL0837]